jgi:hypothetical protein
LIGSLCCVLPDRFAFLQECIKTLDRIFGLHESVQVHCFNDLEFRPDALDIIATRCPECDAQRARALADNIFVNPCERCVARGLADFIDEASLTSSTRPICFARSASMLLPDRSSISACGWRIRSGNRQDAAGAMTASEISGWPSIVSGAAMIRPPAQATSSPPPRH